MSDQDSKPPAMNPQVMVYMPVYPKQAPSDAPMYAYYAYPPYPVCSPPNAENFVDPQMYYQDPQFNQFYQSFVYPEPGDPSYHSHFHQGPSMKHNNIYIKGLSPDFTDADLHDMCIKYGAISSAKAIIDYSTQKCKGFGFVQYDNEDSCHLAMKALVKAGYEVSFAREAFDPNGNRDDMTNSNVYITNLPQSITDEIFASLFEPYIVTSYNLLRDREGNIRGTGFVRLDTHVSALKVIQKLNGALIDGSVEPLKVRFAHPNRSNPKYKIKYDNMNMSNSRPPHFYNQKYQNSPRRGYNYNNQRDRVQTSFHNDEHNQERSKITDKNQRFESDAESVADKFSDLKLVDS